ncbi:M48 family metallopeptidase, partial [Bacteroidota bacterium]
MYQLKIIVLLFLFTTFNYFFISCSTVPLTGRSQLSLIPSNEMLAMSFQQYGEFLKENPVSKNKTETAMVTRVGKRIQTAVENYMAQNNLSDRLTGYNWEFNLVESEQVNAWAMPGGKVVVYTGILPIVHDEEGLAVVLGHEIAHAIAEHGNERMSQELLRGVGAVGLMVALDKEPAQTKALWMGVYGLGTQVGIMLPYARTHESESDRLGLIFMAMAGYDPHEAPSFWERMDANSGGSAPPEFFSTHPSHETRIEDLNAWIPE